MDAAEVTSRLNAAAESLARELLPLGRREGDEWVEASRAQGGMGDSLKVNVKRGVWSHFATGDGGDILDLVAYLVTNGDKKAAFRWALDWLGLSRSTRANGVRSPRPSTGSGRGSMSGSLSERARPQGPPPAAEAAAAGIDTRKSKAALKLFLEADLLQAGDPVDRYLKGRGIDLQRLGRAPGALRCHPSLRDPAGGNSWPGMIAAVTDVHGRHVSTHRTFLSVDGLGAGAAVKAPIANAKLSLGRFRGGAVRLWNGEEIDPETGEVKPGLKLRALQEQFAAGRRGKSGVVVTEGIEDALTVAVACPDRRVMAAVSVANFASIDFPPVIGEVIFLIDNDGDNPHVAKALGRAWRAQQAAGRRVLVAQPPAPFKDINEAYQSELDRVRAG